MSPRICPSCSHTNPDAARFCNACGAALAPHCQACGADNPPGARFCNGCGAPLAARPAPVETRKVVTIVFADLIGSTSLHERLDPESVSRLMDRYYQAVRGPVEAHGGTIVQLLGDGVMCAFGVPRVREDDAIRAVRAAVGIQRAFREFAREQGDAAHRLGLRVALNTGEVVVSTEHPAGLGDPVNVAARLQQEAPDGEVLVGEATQRLVADRVTLEPFGAVTLRGRAEAVTAYRVVSLDRPAGASATPFVGRDEELRRVMAVYDAAVTERRARLAVVLGSPGLGKSRLLTEIARRLGDGATVLMARCDPAGGATFAPLAEALRASLRLDAAAGRDAVRAALGAVVTGDDAARIIDGVAALLAGTPGSPEETFFVVRRFLAALAAAQPAVLAIDDLQWAEPLLLDLTEHLVQWSTGVPLLVLAAARPELRDTRSALTTPGGLVADVVTLGGLDGGAAMRLAASVIGAEELPAAIAGRVLATSEGNPLFVGELVRMLVQDGALKREGDRWTTGVELAKLEMPPTIHALLAARIERLRPEERTVLERAAVIGRQFSRTALAHLLPREQTDLDARLEALRRSELIEPDPTWFLGEPSLRFHHGLTRDAAYRRVLKGTRAELHERVADWIVGKVGEAVEHDETIGWHLEQAHQHLRELGQIDARGRALGERASRYLAAAGRRALARDDLTPAASLLGRALDRLDATDTGRADLALDWCEALLAAGDVGPAAKAVEGLGRFAGGSERLRAWHTCFAGELAVLTNPQALHDTVDAVAAAATDLASAGDGAGEAKAHSVHALALARLGKVGACEAALDRALAAARRAGDRRRSNGVLANAPLAALWGPSPVTRASGRCLDVVRVLRITQGAPAVEAVALRCQAVLEALRGRTDAARRMIASSRRMIEELGITQQLLVTEFFAGLIDLLEGDAAAGERALRGAYEGLRNHGLAIDAARAAAFLGRALLFQGRAADAEAVSHDSESLAGDDLQAAITWRGVRAEALARRGQHAAAVELARAAVDLASATDALLHHADARLALAAALRAAGRRDEAGVEEGRAIDLWEAKGASVLAERARRAFARVRPAERAGEARGELVPRVRRRVVANAATMNADRILAAVAARDADTIAAHVADRSEVVEHTTARTYDRQGLLATWRSLLGAQDGTARIELLATLGDSLALYREWVSASGVAGRTFDVGPYEIERVILIEVDGEGRRAGSEIFAPDRLGDAIDRLYERYAGLLPDGPERARAAATARAVAALPLAGPHDLGRFDVQMHAQDFEYVDHRTVGMGSLHGGEALRRAVAALLDLMSDSTTRTDDVLALRPDGLLLRWTHLGTDRATGGAFERHLCHLWLFGGDGLTTRGEQFDGDRDAEALARFEELTSAPAAPSPAVERRGRWVRDNAATANAARFAAAFVARDFDAVAAHLAGSGEVVDHTAGTTFDRQAGLPTWYAFMRAQDGAYGQEPLATLGDSLALCRHWTSGTSVVSEPFDFGAYEIDHLILVEVDGQGHRRRTEIFAADRLGDAIVRLYERYAEILPDGPERLRAAATARSVPPMLRPLEMDVVQAVLAPGVEFVDHRILGMGSARGIKGFVRGIRSQFDLSRDIDWRIDDIVALRSDAFVVRRTTVGTLREGGGAYERPHLKLCTLGADGLVTRSEHFDVDRDAEALARFEELTTEPVPSRVAEKRDRRVQANLASAHTARLEAAVAARDTDALAGLFAYPVEVVHHPVGVTYDRRGLLGSFRTLLKARDATYRAEPLATLGDSLVVCRQSVSASGIAGATFDVGAYEQDQLLFNEVDRLGRFRRNEVFATDRLGDAIARLYERHAELLPDGPARTRAAATARSVAALPLLSPDVDRYAAALSPDFEFADHRLAAIGSGRGVGPYMEWVRSLFEVADDVATRADDILGLRADALLVRWINSGTQRAGGGAFERHFLMLWVFGADGLVTRLEQFDLESEDEALARFDELAVEPPPAQRRVRANAATANAARLDAAFAARDEDAFLAVFADPCENVHHPTGAVYNARASLATWRALSRAKDPTFHNEPLATLGASLALCRLSWSASGLAGERFDVGAYDGEEVILIEVDGRGQRTRAELFAANRLGDAIVRLYERHSDLLPDGAARSRAAATARSVAASVGPLDLDRMIAAAEPTVEHIDYRIVGIGSVHGVQAFRDSLRALFEAADDMANRVDDVLGLRAEAAVVRLTNFGTDHAGGGAYERPFLILWVFGADGLMTRLEQFDVGHEAEALARFDELTTAATSARPVTRRVRANAATAHAARVDAAIARRDADALPDLYAEGAEFVEHSTGVVYDREGGLLSFRSLLRARDPAYRHEPLATLDAALGLFRVSRSGTGFAGGTFDVGAYEAVQLHLVEVDAQGRCRRLEAFADDRLGDAVTRLYERNAELLPNGPARARAATMPSSVTAGPLDLYRRAVHLAPDVELIDHRTLGTWSARGADAYLEQLRSVSEVAADAATRYDDVLDLRANAFLVRVTHVGTARAGGGVYERPFLLLNVVGTDGLVTRIEVFDLDRDAEALARFDELVAPATVRFENTASRWRDRFMDAWKAHDWDRIAGAFAPGFRASDRRKMMHMELDRDEHLESLRLMFEMRSGFAVQSLATRGERLALLRWRWRFEGSGRNVGPSEVDYLQVHEVGQHGDGASLVLFDPDDLDAAYAELDERYLAGEGARYAGIWRTSLDVGRAAVARDWEQLASNFAPDFVADDHRPLGFGTLSRDEYVTSVRALLDLRPDARLRPHHVLALDDRRSVTVVGWVGTEAEGTFETSAVVVSQYDAAGIRRRADWYDPMQLDAAWARFAELRPDPLRVLPNAASRTADRHGEALNAADMDALSRLCAPTMLFDDRRRGVRLSGDRDMFLASNRVTARARIVKTLLATAGDRLTLEHLRWTDPAAQKLEIENLSIHEVDADGRTVAMITFDAGERRAASIEMLERFAHSDTARSIPAAAWEGLRAVNAHDVDRLRAVLPDDFVMDDHRRTGLGRLDRETYLASLAALFEQAPDVTTENLCTIAVEKHGFFVLARNFGTLRHGGAFESIYLRFTVYRGDRMGSVEMFEPEDLDIARARFEELRSQASTRESAA